MPHFFLQNGETVSWHRSKMMLKKHGGAGDWGPSRNSFHQRGQRSRNRASLGFSLFQTMAFMLKQNQITRELMHHDKKSANVHQAEALQEMCHMTTKSFFFCFCSSASNSGVPQGCAPPMALPQATKGPSLTSPNDDKETGFHSQNAHTHSMKADSTHHPIHINNIPVRDNRSPQIPWTHPGQHTECQNTHD